MPGFPCCLPCFNVYHALHFLFYQAGTYVIFALQILIIMMLYRCSFWGTDNGSRKQVCLQLWFYSQEKEITAITGECSVTLSTAAPFQSNSVDCFLTSTGISRPCTLPQSKYKITLKLISVYYYSKGNGYQLVQLFSVPQLQTGKRQWKESDCCHNWKQWWMGFSWGVVNISTGGSNPI